MIEKMGIEKYCRCFFKHNGVVIVDNKKTIEIEGHLINNLDNKELKRKLNSVEAEPYLHTYREYKQQIVEELKRDINSRRVVLSFYNKEGISENLNCMICAQLLFRNEKLNIHVFSRSSDVYKLKDDLITMKFILDDISKQIKVDSGIICFYAGSFHEYV